MSLSTFVTVNHKLAAINRWQNEDGKLQDHLSAIEHTAKYAIMKARLTAYLAGDGSVIIRSELKRPSNYHHEIRFYPDNVVLAHLFVEAIQYLYRKTPKIIRMKNFYHVTVNSKFICSDLLKDAPYGAMEWSLPKRLLITTAAKQEWLGAFFDCEAYVCAKYVRVESVNKKGLDEVRKLLEDFGSRLKLTSMSEIIPDGILITF